jgi:predicted DNA repair protein MutK
MASGFFAILDDIAALMDDVAMTSKLATKKTAGILGDDLAVNAEKATGFLASREIPVLWAITKGSFINKLIILPVVFVLNWLYPPAIKAALIIGGVYLAYEGVEKIIEYFFHRAKKGKEVIKESKLEDDNENSEKAKVSSAIKTDFILSLEIVIIALGTAMEKQHELITQIISVTLVAIIATIGVYGIVALIVRMDDAGFYLMRKSDNKGFFSSLGGILIKALPIVIKGLAVLGTIALILVSGGIFLHNIEYIHHLIPHSIPSTLAEFGVGIAFGLVAVLLMTGFKKVKGLFVK